MLNEVLSKLLTEDCVLLLIAPCWLNRAWFPVLLGNVIDFLVYLLCHPDFLRAVPEIILRGGGLQTLFCPVEGECFVDSVSKG